MLHNGRAFEPATFRPGCQRNDLTDVGMFAVARGDAVVAATSGDVSQTLAVRVTP